MCAWDAREHAGWTSTKRCSDCHISHRPLASIKGYSIYNFMEDFMHDDLQGLRPSIVGAGMVLCCNHGVFDGEMPPPPAGTWQDRLQARLDRAYRHFCRWAGSHGIRHSVPMFKICQLKLKTLASLPYMKGKAHNIGVLSRWIKERVATISHVDNELNVLNMVLHGMVDLLDLPHELKEKGTLFLNPAERARLSASRQHALEGYCWLWRFAQHTGLARYGARPKLHKLDHLLRRSIRTGVIFSAFWAFCDEDSIGQTARMCTLTYAATMSVRPTQRWLLSFMNNLSQN